MDPNRFGVIGICGWGGLALNAATLGTRVKATVASMMYDMARVNKVPAAFLLSGASQHVTNV